MGPAPAQRPRPSSGWGMVTTRYPAAAATPAITAAISGAAARPIDTADRTAGPRPIAGAVVAEAGPVVAEAGAVVAGAGAGVADVRAGNSDATTGRSMRIIVGSRRWEGRTRAAALAWTWS